MLIRYGGGVKPSPQQLLSCPRLGPHPSQCNLLPKQAVSILSPSLWSPLSAPPLPGPFALLSFRNDVSAAAAATAAAGIDLGAVVRGWTPDRPAYSK